jgi:CBS domain-containing protein
MDENDQAYIDLRPYMFNHPFVVYPHDDLTRANELFRHHHLRHLPVVNPGNGALVGIVTRKDLFKYMAL